MLQLYWQHDVSPSESSVGEWEDDLPALQSHPPASCDHLPSLQTPLILLSLLTEPLQSQPRITSNSPSHIKYKVTFISIYLYLHIYNKIYKLYNIVKNNI